MANVISMSDFKRESSKQDVKEKLFTLNVYASTQGKNEVYKYSLNGSPLVVLTPELVLDSITHLVPDIVGYSTDPAVVQDCLETLYRRLDEVSDDSE